MLARSKLLCARPRSLARRYVSSNNAQGTVSHASLPPAKMRALISLYHQAESFVTPENLSARIDHAFASAGAFAKGLAGSASLSELKQTVAERRSAPRIVEWDQETPTRHRSKTEYMGPGWTESKSMREDRVVEALYGVNLGEAGAKPGWEVLQENAERVRQYLEEDSKGLASKAAAQDT